MAVFSNFVKKCSFFSIYLGLSACSLISSPSLQDTFKQCLLTPIHTDLRRCFGIGAITRLQSIDSSPEFDLIDGLTSSKDATQEYREGTYNYAAQDPSDFRSIVDTFDHVFSKRAMRWNMGFLYPGLSMRIAPSVSPSGVLEFFMEPGTDNVHRAQHFGTGRLLAKSYLIPLLLGLKFNIATLVPIIFGLLVLLAKKIIIISKVALILSAAFGLGSLLFKHGDDNHHSQAQHHYPSNYHEVYHPTTFTHYKDYGEEYPQTEELHYRNSKSVPQDQLKVLGAIPVVFEERASEEAKKGRNFAWNEDEKMKQT